MADVPKDLLDQINRLEELFVVDAAKLKEVTDQFVSELRRGLGEENATIVRVVPAQPACKLTQIAHEPDVVHGIP